MNTRRPPRTLAGVMCAGVSAYTWMLWLGRSYGSSAAERAMKLPGDDIVADPQVTTDHAVTIDAPADRVWPWLVQMGWHRAGWYTARWVDRLLFPANWPSANRIIPELQECHVGDFIPDGPPETECGLIVEQLEPGRALVLHSTSHLPASWRREAPRVARLVVDVRAVPVDDGRRTRFIFRSRWHTAPWWITAGGWLGIMPADFIMSRDMLHGIRQRAEHLTHTQARHQPSYGRHRARHGHRMTQHRALGHHYTLARSGDLAQVADAEPVGASRPRMIARGRDRFVIQVSIFRDLRSGRERVGS